MMDMICNEAVRSKNEQCWPYEFPKETLSWQDRRRQYKASLCTGGKSELQLVPVCSAIAIATRGDLPGWPGMPGMSAILLRKAAC